MAAAIGLALWPVAAWAGVLDTAKQAIGSAAIWGALSLILGVLSLFLHFDNQKAKVALSAIKDAYQTYDLSDDPKSPGGVKRTPEEWEGIAKKALEAIGAVLVALPINWQKKIGLNK
mgnify:CR=1 FL=1